MIKRKVGGVQKSEKNLFLTQKLCTKRGSSGASTSEARSSESCIRAFVSPKKWVKNTFLAGKNAKKKNVLPKNDGHPGKYSQIITDYAFYNLRRDPGEEYYVKNIYPKIPKILRVRWELVFALAQMI